VKPLSALTNLDIEGYFSTYIFRVGPMNLTTCLRAKLTERGESEGIKLLFPSPILCTDNAAMIGSAAYYEYKVGRIADLTLNAVPNLKLGQR